MSQSTFKENEENHCKKKPLGRLDSRKVILDPT